MAIILPDPPYDFNALQPVISAATIKLHHGVHRERQTGSAAEGAPA